jgi:TolB-like protein
MGIAVVPFEVRGQDLEIWREGMMDLLSNGLDGVGGFSTIDSRTVMSRWNDHVGESGTTDLAGTLSVARAVGAQYALEGSVVGLGPNVRLVANVYDLDTEREVATAQAEGPAEDVLRLVDELAVRTMRALLVSIGRAGAGDLSAETITTSSLPALRSFWRARAITAKDASRTRYRATSWRRRRLDIRHRAGASVGVVRLAGESEQRAHARGR